MNTCANPELLIVGMPPEVSLNHQVADLSRRLADLEARLNSLPHQVVEAATEDRIIRIVCNYFGLSLSRLFSEGRSEEITWPRQVAMFLIRERTTYGLTRIANIFDKDHGTVYHACRTVQDRITTDSRSAAQIATLRSTIGQ